MATEVKQKSTYFVVVDQMVENAEGKLTVKEPIYRDHVMYKNAPGHTGPDGVTHPAECKKLVPDRLMGTYEIFHRDPDYRKAIAIMKDQVDDPINPIIGPFDSYAEAMQAKNDARKRCPSELVAEKDVVISSQASEIDALKARIETLSTGKPPATPPDPMEDAPKEKK